MPDIVKTATTDTTCVCCHEPPCVEGLLACRTRGGVAVVCGYSEYVSPSTPPKKYRKKSLSGALEFCYYDSGCINSNGGFKYNYSGFCEIDPSTCLEGSHSVRTLRAADADCNFNGVPMVDNFCGTTGDDDGLDTNLTQTGRTVSGNGTCNPADGSFRIISGSASEALATEDTDEDAFARLLATNPPWSDYGPAPCLALWEQREDDFDFIYQQAEWRIGAMGLSPNSAYTVRVDIFRRLYGSADPYELFQTLTAAGVSDNDGNLEITGDTPNEAGYESYAVASACPPP